MLLSLVQFVIQYINWKQVHEPNEPIIEAKRKANRKEKKRKEKRKRNSQQKVALLKEEEKLMWIRVYIVSISIIIQYTIIFDIISLILTL